MYQDELKKSSERIKFYMNNHGLTIQQLANLCNCTRVTISRVINEKYPLSDRLAHDMGRIFSVSPDYLKGTVDDPGTNSFVGSDAWFKRNSQYYYIARVASYLRSLEYSITELVIFDDIEFKRDNKTLVFSAYDDQQKFLNYGFELKNTDYPVENSHLFIKFECTEDILIKKMQDTSAHISHYWEIAKENIFVRLDEAHFLNIMYSFALLTQNFFNAAIYDLKQIDVELSDLERMIQSKGAEPSIPSEEEDEQRLLHAIYGEKIPENQKKEE